MNTEQSALMQTKTVQIFSTIKIAYLLSQQNVPNIKYPQNIIGAIPTYDIFICYHCWIYFPIVQAF